MAKKAIKGRLGTTKFLRPIESKSDEHEKGAEPSNHRHVEMLS